MGDLPFPTGASPRAGKARAQGYSLPALAIRSDGARWLERWRIPVLVTLLLACVFFAWQGHQLGVETENESLNVPDREGREAYAEFRQRFGNDEDVLIALHDPHLLTPPGLERVANLTRELQRLPGVAAVLSLATAPRIVRVAAGAEVVPLLSPPWDRPDIASELEQALSEMPEWRDWWLSRDRSTTGLVVSFHDDATAPEKRAQVLSALQALAARWARDGVELRWTGIAVQKQEVTRYVQRDERLLLPLAVGVLAVVLALFFRNWLGTLLPLAAAGLTVTTVLGGLALAGYRLNAITSLLPPVLLVLAVTPSVHLLQVWWHEAQADDPLERAWQTLQARWWPCTLCALTTAAGFAALTSSQMPAVRQFGAAAAVGALVSLVVSLAGTTIGLSFLPPRIAARTPSALHPWLERLVTACTSAALRSPSLVLLLAVGSTLLLGLGILRVRNNTDLVRFLRPEAPLRQHTLWIEQHLTGPYAVDFVVRRRDRRPLSSRNDLERIHRWQEAMRAQAGVRNAVSVVDFLRRLSGAEFDLPAPAIPADDASVQEMFSLLERAPDPTLLRRFLPADRAQVRVHVRLGAIGTQELQRTAEALLLLAADHLGGEYEVRPTGAFFFLARDSNRLVQDQVRSFALSLVLVSALIGIALRSLRVAALALVPNLLPLVMVGGIMGLAGIDLSSGTAMIAAAALGLVVDDTIHYLAAFRTHFQGNALHAVRAAAESVGAALVLNNLLLVAGFWVGMAGSFLPTVYFSLLTGLAMILGLLCDLLVTPACLLLWRRRS